MEKLKSAEEVSGFDKLYEQLISEHNQITNVHASAFSPEFIKGWESCMRDVAIISKELTESLSQQVSSLTKELEELKGEAGIFLNTSWVRENTQLKEEIEKFRSDNESLTKERDQLRGEKSRIAEHLGIGAQDGYAHFINAINGLKEKAEETSKLRGLLQEIDAWLSFNRHPSAEELLKMRGSIESILSQLNDGK